MVPRLTKKTVIFTTKDRRNHRRCKKCPIKGASTAVVSSINKSIYTLIKIFSALAQIISLRRKNSRRNGYRVLNKHPEHHNLPPARSRERKTVFLDLDETLIHSQLSPQPEKYDFMVRPMINGQRINFYVLKRPFVDELLETLSEKYEIVVFTAGLKEYASEVIDRLDWKEVISHRFYRDSCKEVNGRYVKDLSKLGRDLKNVVIVDDNPNSFVFQPDNGIPIRPFTNNLDDGELWRLIDFFEESDCFDDMRDAVRQYLAQEEEYSDLD